MATQNAWGGGSGGSGGGFNSWGQQSSDQWTRPQNQQGQTTEDVNRTNADMYGAGQSALAHLYGAQAAAQGQVGAATQAAEASKFGSQTAADEAKYGTDVGYKQALAGYGNQKDIAGIQAAASELPAQLKQQRFDTILPMFQGLLGGGRGGAGGLFGGGGVFTAGGQNTPPPSITAGGVYSPQQVQEQVNAARAGNDATSATQQRLNAQRTAGSGYGSTSPLLMALNAQNAAANMATNADAERNIRQTAAQQNAQQLLAGQTEAANVWQQQNALDIQRRVPYLQQQTALLSALAGLAG